MLTIEPRDLDDPFRIIVVEDDPGHAVLLERTLRRAGVRNEVLHFHDGEEVLAYLRTGEARTDDLLLLDLHMPRMDGFEVLHRMQSDERLPRLPVIVLTTTDDPQEMATCHALGCRSYLVKPIDHEAFLRAVREVGLTPFVEDAG